MQNLVEPQASIVDCTEHKDLIKVLGNNDSMSATENIVVYGQHAKNFDFIQKITGFNDPAMIVKYLAEQNFSKESKIIDFGCGTGLVGVELTKNGFTNIVGVDGSQEMLEVARSKQMDGKPVYRELC